MFITSPTILSALSHREVDMKSEQVRAPFRFDAAWMPSAPRAVWECLPQVALSAQMIRQELLYQGRERAVIVFDRALCCGFEIRLKPQVRLRCFDPLLVHV